MTLDQTSFDEDSWGDDCSTYTLRSYHLNFTIKNTTDAAYYLSATTSCSPYCPWGLNPNGMRGSLSPGQTTLLNL